MVTEQLIRQAYIHLRKINTSIPDETLDFMLQSSLEALKNKKSTITPNEATVPQIKSNEELRAFIMQMEVDVKYRMHETFRNYTQMRIDKDFEYGYSWVLYSEYDSHFPLKSGYVQNFKTEAGCKKNLIKRFGNWFKEPEQKPGEEKSFFQRWNEVIKKM
jgi:hypothetical protein